MAKTPDGLPTPGHFELLDLKEKIVLGRVRRRLDLPALMPKARAEKFDCSVRVITPENIEFEYALAGPFQRLPAFLFDVLLRITTYCVIIFLMALLFSWIAIGSMIFGVAAFLLFFIFSWFYGIYFESRFNGRTPGKMIFRLRVISSDGRPINTVQAALRNLLRLADMNVLVSLQLFSPEAPPMFIIPTMSVGLVAMALTRRMQRLGDLAAGTMVVSEVGKRSPWNLQPDDLRAFGLAELIPATYPISSSLAQTVGMYMENRARFSPARRMEVAKHLSVPLIKKFELLPDTSPDLLLCALYVRIFLSEQQQQTGRERMRQNPAPAGRNPRMPGVTSGARGVVPGSIEPLPRPLQETSASVSLPRVPGVSDSADPSEGERPHG